MRNFFNHSLIILLAMIHATWMIAGESKAQEDDIVTLDIKQAYEKDSREITFTFAVAPKKGYEILEDGPPWNIMISKAEHLSFDGKTDQAYSSNSFDAKIPGFQVKAKVQEGQQSGTFSYQMRTFVCQDDKSKCFPRTLKGESKWKI